MISFEKIGAIFTKVAAADQGFLILVLTAATKASCDLSPDETETLAKWGESIRGLGKEESDQERFPVL